MRESLLQLEILFTLIIDGDPSDGESYIIVEDDINVSNVTHTERDNQQEIRSILPDDNLNQQMENRSNTVAAGSAQHLSRDKVSFLKESLAQSIIFNTTILVK